MRTARDSFNVGGETSGALGAPHMAGKGTATHSQPRGELAASPEMLALWPLCTPTASGPGLRPFSPSTAPPPLPLLFLSLLFKQHPHLSFLKCQHT